MARLRSAARNGREPFDSITPRICGRRYDMRSTGGKNHFAGTRRDTMLPSMGDGLRGKLTGLPVPCRHRGRWPLYAWLPVAFMMMANVAPCHAQNANGAPSSGTPSIRGTVKAANKQGEAS